MMWTLVTGASKGLGRSIALRLADMGHSLIIHYCNDDDCAKEVESECHQKGAQVKLIKGDFSKPESVEAFLSQVDNVTHLVNNVGYYYVRPGSETPLSVWQNLYQVNFFAPLALIQGCLPTITADRGSIVNIGSVGVGMPRADAKFTAYTSSKMSLHFLTRSLAKELASKGVRVNMVSPGEMENSVTNPDDPSKLPMGRPGTLKETADAVVFLMNPENDYITGQNIEVGGALAL